MLKLMLLDEGISSQAQPGLGLSDRKTLRNGSMSAKASQETAKDDCANPIPLVHRQSLKGYKDIERCQQGSAVFYESYHCRRKNLKTISYTEADAIKVYAAKRGEYYASQRKQRHACISARREANGAGLQHMLTALHQQTTTLSLTAEPPARSGQPCLHSAGVPAQQQPGNSGKQGNTLTEAAAAAFPPAAGMPRRALQATEDSQAALLTEQQQQQEREEMEHEVANQQHIASCWDASRVCNHTPLSPLDAASRLLLPQHSVLLSLLTKHQGSYRKCQEQQQLQLKVVGLLGRGATSEAHEVQELPPANGAANTPGTANADDSAGSAAATAGINSSSGCCGNTGDSSCTGAPHMALKVPLRWTCVTPHNQKSFSGEVQFYMWSRRQLEKEFELLTQLAGKPGITRCFGLGLVSFTTQSCLDVTARGLLLELAELGDLQQQLVPEPGVFVPMSASEAWAVVKDMVRALCCVHRITKHVYEDLKPANICCSRVSGKVTYKLIDFSSCIKVEEGGVTLPQVVGGTAGFMAPEAAAGAAHSYSADTWSLGMLLVALRTGCVSGINLEALPTALDSREQAFVRCALQHDWQLRPAACELLSEPYVGHGPESQAAALLDADLSEAWGFVNEDTLLD